MTGADPRAELRRYLQTAPEAVLWKLDGLSEYDFRRPLTPTGTNLPGLVKHLVSARLRCSASWWKCLPKPTGTPGAPISSAN